METSEISRWFVENYEFLVIGLGVIAAFKLLQGLLQLAGYGALLVAAWFLWSEGDPEAIASQVTPERIEESIGRIETDSDGWIGMAATVAERFREWASEIGEEIEAEAR